MWLMVTFDLPVGTRQERRNATRFRNLLLDEGFVMKQWSVYQRYFISREKAEAAADRIGDKAPPMGDVSMIFLTDKQFGLTRNYVGRNPIGTEKKPNQLALF
jgi:CRISPR-associated protein Cas2